MRLPKYLLVCLVLVATAACSSGGSSKASAPTTTVATITKASYLVKANAICTTMNRRIQALGDPGDNRARAANTIDDFRLIVGDALHDLRALPVPAGDGATIAAIYATVDRLRASFAAYAVALRGRDQRIANIAGRRAAAIQRLANAASNKYGLTVCGS